MNCVAIFPNAIHEDIHDLLMDNDLNMHLPSNKEMIYYHITNFIKKSEYFSIRELNENTISAENNIFESIANILGDYTKMENIQMDTVLLWSDENVMYEMIYLENEKQTEDMENQYGSLVNQNLSPIYGMGIIIKTNIKTQKLDRINILDVANIFLKTFYHSGLMLHLDETIQEIEYMGDNPIKTIGTTFKLYRTVELFHLTFVLYAEDSEIKNTMANNVFKDITGRCFICVLSPRSFSKYWNINKNIFMKIVEIMETDELYKKISDKLCETNKTLNPYYLMFENTNAD